jgi:hypothetical protein
VPRDAFALLAMTEHGYVSSSMQLRDAAAGARGSSRRIGSSHSRRRTCVSILYGATFFAPVTKYSVSAKHEEGTPWCCS